ncbi:hypothetical protein AGMMS4956_20170 [Bacteroidia bacterium]|nr:hypothetical protein AGMMS4956_20170 [Bacteroidia bacterium]
MYIHKYNFYYYLCNVIIGGALTTTKYHLSNTTRILVNKMAIEKAEIIPVEPDADNAAVGNINKYQLSSTKYQLLWLEMVVGTW